MKRILRALLPSLSIAAFSLVGCGDDADDNDTDAGTDAGQNGGGADSGTGGTSGMDSGTSGNGGTSGTDAGVDASVDVDASADLDASADASTDASADASDAGLCPDGDESLAVDVDDNGISDCAENMLTNAQFVSNISGWTEEPSTEGTHITTNMDAGLPSSGALQVTSTVMLNAPSTAGVGQCVQVNDQSQYVMGGQFFTASDQGIAGLAAQISIKLYEGTACDGNLVNDGGTTIDATVGAWTTQTAFVNTTSAHSVFVAASVRKAASDGSPGVVIFDNLLLRENP